eukprot:CAMPEP_0168341928 /NCGR_PEP_ID=MMETSP0213-20121227/15034_1 /TAXON_ID=151035 /ORGANISM="Euplotes harpa, Strain FSP1.4" /LENGTH=196 /DNA_ID=CAMNT_0008348615 /DNA_START=337 /DNA_END=927 /DNA_ORIENTATION=+
MFNSSGDSKAIYEQFLDKAMPFIRAVNTYIVDEGSKLNKEVAEFYTLIDKSSSGILTLGSDFQVIHFCVFSNNQEIAEKFVSNPEDFPGKILMTVIVPKGCLNACKLQVKSSFLGFTWVKESLVLIPPYSIFQVSMVNKNENTITVKVMLDNKAYIKNHPVKSARLMQKLDENNNSEVRMAQDESSILYPQGNQTM